MKITPPSKTDYTFVTQQPIEDINDLVAQAVAQLPIEGHAFVFQGPEESGRIVGEYLSMRPEVHVTSSSSDKPRENYFDVKTTSEPSERLVLPAYSAIEAWDQLHGFLSLLSAGKSVMNDARLSYLRRFVPVAIRSPHLYSALVMRDRFDQKPSDVTPPRARGLQQHFLGFTGDPLGVAHIETTQAESLRRCFSSARAMVVGAEVTTVPFEEAVREIAFQFVSRRAGANHFLNRTLTPSTVAEHPMCRSIRDAQTVMKPAAKPLPKAPPKFRAPKMKPRKPEPPNT